MTVRILSVTLLGLGLAACNQTTQTAEVSVAPAVLPAASRLPPAQDLPPPSSRGVEQPVTIAPLYEPLIDTSRVNPAKLRRDLQECRAQGAPQEAAARRAQKQQETGTAIQAVGTIASLIPVPGFRQASIVAGAANSVSSVGASNAEAGAEGVARATEDYILVINACMEDRRYRLLR